MASEKEQSSIKTHTAGGSANRVSRNEGDRPADAEQRLEELGMPLPAPPHLFRDYVRNATDRQSVLS
jgi:hypothetical protein